MRRLLGTTICGLGLIVASLALAAKDKGNKMQEQAPVPLEAAHKEMAKLAGTYTVASKFWMEPGKAPMESTGTAKFTSILNGRFLRQEFQGMMMGQKFEGIGIDGYDSVGKRYQAIWLDDMSNGMMTTIGASTDGGKTITSTGEMSCPMTKKILPVRTVYTNKGNGMFTFEMYTKMDNKEFKTMEITYTRKG